MFVSEDHKSDQGKGAHDQGDSSDIESSPGGARFLSVFQRSVINNLMQRFERGVHLPVIDRARCLDVSRPERLELLGQCVSVYCVCRENVFLSTPGRDLGHYSFNPS